MNPSQFFGKTLRFGLFVVNLEERSLAKRGVPVKLQEKPFQILAILLERPGEVVSRDDLKTKLWQADTFVEFDDGLNTAIKKLRIALDDSSENPVYIETVPRRGYRFLAPLERLDDRPPDRLSAQEADLPNSLPHAGNLPPTEARPSVVRESSDRPSSKPLNWASISRRQRLLITASLLAFALLAIGLAVNVKVRETQRQSLVAEMGNNLQVRGSARTTSRHPIDPRAYEDYLLARQYWRERTAEAIGKAVDYFGRAIERDPNYAEAYAGLANCYVVLPMLSTLPQENAHRKARQAADKALVLDDSLAEAHLALAELKLYDDWDFSSAEKEFKRTLELDPNFAQGHQWYAEFLSLMSRHVEAIAEIQTAQQLDPTSMIAYHQAGQIFQNARRYDDAFQQYRKALQIQPGFGPTYSAMATMYRRQGRYRDSLEVLSQANSYWEPGSTVARDLDKVKQAYSEAGERGFFRATLEFEKKHPGKFYIRAWDYALLGENEQALYWLQQSFQQRELDILGLQNDPEFDSLRTDPRFQTIMKAIRFKQS